MEVRENEQYPQNAEDTCAEQHDDERRKRLADAAHRPAEDLHETMREVKDEYGPHALHAPIDDHGFFREQQHQLRPEIQRRQRHRHDDDLRQADTVEDEHLHTFERPSTVQLPRKTDGRVVETTGPRVHHHFDVQRGRVSGHCQCAERIDGRLDENIRKGETYALESSRKAQFHDLLENVRLDCQSAETQPANFIRLRDGAPY